MKCTKDGYCETLENRMGEEHQKGLTTLSTINFKTGHIERVFAVYKMTARDRGLVLNFCPWCGEKLYEPETVIEEK